MTGEKQMWKSSDALPPSDPVLVYIEGRYHIAVLHRDDDGAAWMDVHTDAILPKPSHWKPLTPPM